MMIFSKICTTDKHSDSPVNLVKFKKLLKSVEMMSTECIKEKVSIPDFTFELGVQTKHSSFQF